MKISRSIFKAVSVITIFSIITRFFGFIFRVYLSRNLGAEGLGIYQISASILGIFMTLIASGLPLTTAKLVAKYDAESKLKSKFKLITSALILALILSIFSCILILGGQKIFKLFVSEQSAKLLIYMCPALIFSAIYAVLRGALWGENKFFWVSFTELIEQIARLILTFFLLIGLTNINEKNIVVAKTFSIASMLSCILVIVVYFCSGNRLNFKKGEYKHIIKSSTPITSMHLASSFVQPLGAILIPALLMSIGYTKSSAISEYGIIMGMTFPLLYAPLAIIGSISMVMVPKISKLNAQNDNETITKSVKSCIEFSIFLAMIIIPIFLSVGDKIGIVLFKNYSSGLYLQYASICILPMVLCNISNSILNAMNMETKTFKHYLISTVIMFVSLIAFTKFLGANAIILSFILSMGTTAILNIKLLKKKLSFDFNFYSLITKYLIFVLISSLLGHFVSNILSSSLSPFFSGLIGGGIALLSTLLLIHTFKIYDFKFNFTKKKRKIKT